MTKSKVYPILMLTGLTILATVAVLGVFSHRHDRFSTKIFKNVPLNEWLMIAVFPILIYFGWVIIIKNIMMRDNMGIFVLDDIDILSIMLLSFIYGFIAIALHFGAKVMWMYLKTNPKSMAYRVNEMFHGKLSHYLAFLNALFVFFAIGLLEINHPLDFPMEKHYLSAIIGAGIIFGLASSKAIFYTNEWFGGYNRPLFFVIAILLTILTFVFNVLGLKFSFYPVNSFIHTFFISILVAIVVRQMLIFSKLPAKGKLRFLSRMMSV